MGVAAGKAEIDRSYAMMSKLDIGRVGEKAYLRAALHGQPLAAGRLLNQRDQRRMGDRPVERTAPMEAVKAHCGAESEANVTARLHVGRICGQHQIELDCDVGRERLSSDQGAAQIELLLGREDEMNRRAIGQG